MNLAKLIRQVEKMAADNSPTILTAVGVTGVVGTAYLAGRATVAATRVLDREENFRKVTDKPVMTKREKFEMVWKLYIPPVLSASLTVASIVCANRIGNRRTAAMASAVVLSERAFDEYKTKVVETVGKKKEQEVRAEIAQDRVNANPPSGTIIVSDGKTLCHDAYSGRYFMSDMETLRRAENDINQQIFREDFATLTNFYNNIGLEPTSASSEMGWNTDKKLELLFAPIMTPDGRPCLSFDFGVVPHRDPWRFC
jgi:hypothetical protein